MSFRVVVNADGQYSIWPDDSTVPGGWIADGTIGSREECLDHIDRVWTDMRPARAWIRTWLCDTIAATSDGQLTAAEVRSGGRTFQAMGLTSLATVRLIDAIDREFDITVDFDSDGALEGLERLTEFIAVSRVRSMVAG
jgi:MbtH protein